MSHACSEARFKSIAFVSSGPEVLRQTKLFKHITTAIPQKLVGINKEGNIKMSSNHLVVLPLSQKAYKKAKRGQTIRDASLMGILKD